MSRSPTIRDPATSVISFLSALAQLESFLPGFPQQVWLLLFLCKGHPPGLRVATRAVRVFVDILAPSLSYCGHVMLSCVTCLATLVMQTILPAGPFDLASSLLSVVWSLADTLLDPACIAFACTLAVVWGLHACFVVMVPSFQWVPSKRQDCDKSSDMGRVLVLERLWTPGLLSLPAFRWLCLRLINTTELAVRFACSCISHTIRQHGAVLSAIMAVCIFFALTLEPSASANT
eukprot:scaffold214103_cov47-Prasinocladus_malaysianus.AAC.1